jgi:hypothetical protein
VEEGAEEFDEAGVVGLGDEVEVDIFLAFEGEDVHEGVHDGFLLFGRVGEVREGFGGAGGGGVGGASGVGGVTGSTGRGLVSVGMPATWRTVMEQRRQTSGLSEVLARWTRLLMAKGA